MKNDPSVTFYFTREMVIEILKKNIVDSGEIGKWSDHSFDLFVYNKSTFVNAETLECVFRLSSK